MTTQPKETKQFVFTATMFHICHDCRESIQIGSPISWKLTGQDAYKINNYAPVHEVCPNAQV